MTPEEYKKQKSVMYKKYKAGEITNYAYIQWKKKNNPDLQGSAAKTPMSMSQLLELETKLANKLNAHEIASTAYLDAMDKLQEMYNKKASFEEAKAAAGLGPAIVQTDPGTQATDQAVAKLEKELKKVYGDAAKEMKAELKEFTDEYGPKLAEKHQALLAGEITQEEYSKWVQSQMLHKQTLQQKIDQLTGVTLEANKKAMGMINGQQVNVFAENANYQAYQLTQDTKMNLMFSVYDEHTAQKLIKDKPELLPRKEVNGKKDKAWNKKQIANAVARAVIQGESIPKLAKRIAADTASTNMKAMVRYARTAMTAAQNSGRMEMLHQAQGMGIQVKKTWLATLDSRTRDSHAAMDGVTVDVDKKFPNGLMYPGDPNGIGAEVYNCRCTLIYDYEGFPNDPTEDQRYDQESGQLITDMSYGEWKAAKEGSKLNELNLYKTQLAEAQKAVVKANIDETKQYEGIWKDPVTLADYPAKKDAIQAKRDYYETEIQKYKDAQAMGSSWATDEKIKELEKKKKLLNEFEKKGQLIEKRDKALQAVQDVYTQVGYGKTAAAPAVAKAQKGAKKAASAAGGTSTGAKTQKAAGLNLGAAGAKKTPFGPEAYTQERKDKALWSRDKKYVDSVMRDRTGEVWSKAPMSEREAIYEYTRSFSKFNEPLRGIEYGTNRYLGVGNTNLNARSNGKTLNAMTDIIDKCSYDHDMWLQRGCRFNGMDKFFQIDERTLRYGSQKDLENALLGKTVTEYGFMSMGSAKGQGFSGDILLNIYAPAGTKMMYAEPFSAYGGGEDLGWDGKRKQSAFGHEFETIMQQGTQFRITKVEKSGGQLYVDIEVINQDTQQRYKGR